MSTIMLFAVLNIISEDAADQDFYHLGNLTALISTMWNTQFSLK